MSIPENRPVEPDYFKSIYLAPSIVPVIDEDIAYHNRPGGFPVEDPQSLIAPPMKETMQNSLIKYQPPSPKEYAASLVNPEQFGCLEKLWERESNWRWDALNKSSGAYGIPQALPGKKMASAGDDWQTNPQTQINWGLAYIAARYGSSCNAWAYFLKVGWY